MPVMDNKRKADDSVLVVANKKTKGNELYIEQNRDKAIIGTGTVSSEQHNHNIICFQLIFTYLEYSSYIKSFRSYYAFGGT